jgi:hypothetical protein
LWVLPRLIHVNSIGKVFYIRKAPGYQGANQWHTKHCLQSIASHDTQETNKFPHALILPKTSFHLPSEPSSGRAMIVYTETPERQVHEPGVSTHKNATTGIYTQNATADTTPLNPAVVSNYNRQDYKLKQRSYLI